MATASRIKKLLTEHPYTFNGLPATRFQNDRIHDSYIWVILFDVVLIIFTLALLVANAKNVFEGLPISFTAVVVNVFAAISLAGAMSGDTMRRGVGLLWIVFDIVGVVAFILWVFTNFTNPFPYLPEYFLYLIGQLLLTPMLFAPEVMKAKLLQE